MQTIVTRESLQEMINNADEVKVQHIVGRALVVLLKRQTAAEQSNNTTLENNNIGFAACDAKSGTLTAKSYIKWNRLLDWQVAKWIKIQSNGYSRICKYHRQLNVAANKKQS